MQSKGIEPSDFGSTPHWVTNRATGTPLTLTERFSTGGKAPSEKLPRIEAPDR